MSFYVLKSETAGWYGAYQIPWCHISEASKFKTRLAWQPALSTAAVTRII